MHAIGMQGTRKGRQIGWFAQSATDNKPPISLTCRLDLPRESDSRPPLSRRGKHFPRHMATNPLGRYYSCRVLSPLISASRLQQPSSEGVLTLCGKSGFGSDCDACNTLEAALPQGLGCHTETGCGTVCRDAELCVTMQASGE